MKIKITGNVPVQPQICPKIGEEYTVRCLHGSSSKEKVFYISVNGSAVGVRSRYCEIIEK